MTSKYMRDASNGLATENKSKIQYGKLATTRSVSSYQNQKKMSFNSNLVKWVGQLSSQIQTISSKATSAHILRYMTGLAMMLEWSSISVSFTPNIVLVCKLSLYGELSTLKSTTTLTTKSRNSSLRI